jgi:hypothetical protein
VAANGGTAHALLRLTGERSDLGRVLDVIGVAMVIPMPPLWVCDMALIAADRFRLPELAVVNPTVQLWETALFGIGLRTSLGVPLAARHAGRAGRQRGLCPGSLQVPAVNAAAAARWLATRRPGHLPCGEPPADAQDPASPRRTLNTSVRTGGATPRACVPYGGTFVPVARIAAG